MKKIKIITTIFVIILLLLISVNTYAYSGVIRFNDKIFMPENLENGEGTIEVTRDVTNYSLYYQWVEIDNSTYKEIRKLKDELLVVQYYNTYEVDSTDENYDAYTSAYEYYKDLYGSTVDNYTEERIDEIESTIVSLWPNYTDNWTQSSNNSAKIDLNSFSGNKDFTLWVKVVTSSDTIYFADVYEITGTKTTNNDDDKKQEDKENDDSEQEDKGNNNNKQEDEKDNNDNKQEDEKDNNSKNDNEEDSSEKNDSTASKDKTSNNISNKQNDSTTAKTNIPKAGSTNLLPLLIATSLLISIISYAKYKRH